MGFRLSQGGVWVESGWRPGGVEVGCPGSDGLLLASACNHAV